jgi:hypothetical protein
VEFLLTIDDRSLPPCRGWIDVLFRDKEGVWRIVAFHTDEKASLDAAAKRRRPFLALQALAARRQTGQECGTIEMFDVRSGKSKRIEKADAKEAWEIIKGLTSGLNSGCNS